MSSLTCTGCMRGVHLRGECSRWGCGVHLVYSPRLLGNRSLGPDCMWLWVQALASGVRRSPAPLVGEDIRRHLNGVASSCAVGAGAAVVRPRCTLRTIRRWLLSYLCERGWVRTAVLKRECARAHSASSANSLQLGSLLAHALHLLAREGALAQDRQGRDAAVKLGQQAPRAVHSRRRRRRDHDVDRRVRRRVVGSSDLNMGE